MIYTKEVEEIYFGLIKWMSSWFTVVSMGGCEVGVFSGVFPE